MCSMFMSTVSISCLRCGSSQTAPPCIRFLNPSFCQAHVLLFLPYTPSWKMDILFTAHHNALHIISTQQILIEWMDELVNSAKFSNSVPLLHLITFSIPAQWSITSVAKLNLAGTSWCPHCRDASCLVWMRMVWLDIWDLHRMQSAWSCRRQCMFKPMKERKDRGESFCTASSCLRSPISTLQGSSRN